VATTVPAAVGKDAVRSAPALGCGVVDDPGDDEDPDDDEGDAVAVGVPGIPDVADGPEDTGDGDGATVRAADACPTPRPARSTTTKVTVATASTTAHHARTIPTSARRRADTAFTSTLL
jgi:hypothetical protein